MNELEKARDARAGNRELLRLQIWVTVLAIVALGLAFLAVIG